MINRVQTKIFEHFDLKRSIPAKKNCLGTVIDDDDTENEPQIHF